MSFPRVYLEQDPEDIYNFNVRYDPPSESWLFEGRSKDELRNELITVIREFKRELPPGTIFGTAEQNNLRLRILTLLLYWVANHQLHIFPKV